MSTPQAYDSTTTTFVARISHWLARWFWPQYRLNRTGFFRDQCLLMGVLAGVVWLGTTFERALWISDATWNALVIVGQFVLNVITMAIFVSCIRRVHDCGWSGGWVFFLFVPGLNIIWYLILLCLPGTKRVLGWQALQRESWHYE